MSEPNDPIEFKRYALHAYYGPPIEADRVAGREFSYMLTIPFRLSVDQMKTLLQMISLMSPIQLPEKDGIELMVPKDIRWEGEMGWVNRFTV